MNWVTQPGWTLMFEDEMHVDLAASRLLGIVVANGDDTAAVEHLKERACRHRHPRGGTNRLTWVEMFVLGGSSKWEAAGRDNCEGYSIEPYTVEVLS